MAFSIINMCKIIIFTYADKTPSYIQYYNIGKNLVLQN